jgi:hypothetical protein
MPGLIQINGDMRQINALIQEVLKKAPVMGAE